jgi:hypothetical protein
MSRPLSDRKDSEAMLQAKQTMMTETPIRKETNAVHRTNNNDMRTLVTKLGPKDGKKNEETANSVKSQTSKVAVPEVTIVTSSDENLFDASADMNKRTKIEQQSKQKRKMNAVTSTIETGNERKSAASDSLPITINIRSESPRKSSHVQVAAIRVTEQGKYKRAAERPIWFPKRPNIGYIVENNESTHAAMKMFEKIQELTKQPREWYCADVLKDEDHDYSGERARQLAEEYCHESTVDVLHCLFHKRDDEDSLQYRKDRRDYAQIEL